LSLEHWKQLIAICGDVSNYCLKPFTMVVLELINGQALTVLWSFVQHKKSDHADSPNIHLGRLNTLLRKHLRRDEFRTSG
jgi:hypothetical protein